jgi:adenylosuccinate synthase
VLDPAVFKKEIDKLGLSMAELKNRLYISKKAHLILPGHRLLDAAYESSKGNLKIGSTLKGIGPAYTDKAGRNGLRVGDILRKDFKKLYLDQLNSHFLILKNYDFKYELSEYENGWFEGIELLKQFNLINSEYVINNLLSEKKRVLAEGAQGTMLDVDFGSYPFVTSSSTISAGACTGLGISPKQTGEIFGIFKAYCTRVGSGPFPTELNNETGEKLRKTGFEFGATTGRPRRCGWLDLPALKYSIMINGVTKLFMTKSDVLSGFNSIKVCVAYKIDGKETSEIPFEHDTDIQPIYREFAGWKEDITSVKEYSALPVSLKQYIEFIETETKVPVTIVSVGPDRKETIFR